MLSTGQGRSYQLREQYEENTLAFSYFSIMSQQGRQDNIYHVRFECNLQLQQLHRFRHAAPRSVVVLYNSIGFMAQETQVMDKQRMAGGGGWLELEGDRRKQATEGGFLVSNVLEKFVLSSCFLYYHSVNYLSISCYHLMVD